MVTAGRRLAELGALLEQPGTDAGGLHTGEERGWRCIVQHFDIQNRRQFTRIGQLIQEELA